MSFELRLDEEVAADIEQYVLERFNPHLHRLEATEQILSFLHDIADDPLSEGTTTPGPFPGLVAVKQLEIDDVSYPVRIAYHFSQDEQAIEVVGFKAQAF